MTQLLRHRLCLMLARTGALHELGASDAIAAAVAVGAMAALLGAMLAYRRSLGRQTHHRRRTARVRSTGHRPPAREAARLLVATAASRRDHNGDRQWTEHRWRPACRDTMWNGHAKGMLRVIQPQLKVLASPPPLSPHRAHTLAHNRRQCLQHAADDSAAQIGSAASDFGRSGRSRPYLSGHGQWFLVRCCL